MTKTVTIQLDVAQKVAHLLNMTLVPAPISEEPDYRAAEKKFFAAVSKDTTE